jgi:hypothetical protein
MLGTSELKPDGRRRRNNMTPNWGTFKNVYNGSTCASFEPLLTPRWLLRARDAIGRLLVLHLPPCFVAGGLGETRSYHPCLLPERGR